MKRMISCIAAIFLALMFFTGCANFKITINPDAAAIGAEILGHRLGYALAQKAPAKVDLYLTQADGLLSKLASADPAAAPNVAIQEAFGILVAELSSDPLLSADIRSASKLIQFNVAATDPDYAAKYKAWIAGIQAGVTGLKDGILAYRAIARK
jgi:hypothetical protein